MVASRGPGQQGRDVAPAMRHDEHEVGREAAPQRRRVAREVVESHALHRRGFAERLRHGPGIGLGRGREDADQQHPPPPAAPARGRQPRRHEAGDLAGAEPERQAVVDQCVDPAMEGGEPIVRPVGAAPPGHEGAGARPALDEAGFLEVAVDLAHRHGGDAGLLGEVAHRGQAVAGPELAAGDAVGEKAAQLQAERYWQAAVEGEADRGDVHLY